MNRRGFIKSAGLAGLAASFPLTAAGSGKRQPVTKSINKNNSCDDSWDVIVVGGGPSGCAAAVAAAREGAKTLLIEAMGVLGGMGTAGMVPAWCPFSDGEKIIYKGIAEKVFRESKKGMPQIPENKLDWVSINVEYLKVVYDNLVKEYGVKVLFFSRLAAVNMKADDTVESILIANKAGLNTFKAKVYVDCTGDADLAAWAGDKVFIGNDKGETQKPSFCFTFANVNEEAFYNAPKLHYSNKESLIYKIIASKEYPLIIDDHVFNPMIAPGIVQFNIGHMKGFDLLNPNDLTEAMFRGRQMVVQYHEAFRKYMPEIYGDSFIVNTCSLLSVRETRRIEGDYIFTINDWLARKDFDDSIGRNNYYVDVHIGDLMNDERYEHYKKGETHGIPYRLLTPKGLNNVLVAGRPISTDSMAFGALRVMPPCLVTGEAAGLAAVLAAKQSVHNVHQIDVQHLRKRLTEEGQRV
ncbi:membrane protein [Bacteroidia bacterium]|nr:membrane protein [Bacteroidia bacterium]